MFLKLLNLTQIATSIDMTGSVEATSTLNASFINMYTLIPSRPRSQTVLNGTCSFDVTVNVNVS